MRRLTARRFAAILLAGGALVAISIPRVGYAAAPDVRIVTPAGIDIDGNNGDWDSQSADFLSDMYQAGNSAKPVLSKLYGRYDCGTNTFYVHVVTVQGWSILPSDNDNYVKLGQTDKLVDGSDPPGGNPPSFAYIAAKAWEAAFDLDPGSYLGDGGLNVHAEVQPDGKGDTSAVAGRRLDVVITCPNPTPTPAPTATPTAKPTATPTAPPTPTAPASASPSVGPSEQPSEAPSASASSEVPSAPASEVPSGSEAPSASASEEAPASASAEPSASTPVESEIPSEGSEPPPSASVAPSESAAPSSPVESEIASPSAAPSGSVEPTQSASPSGSAEEETSPPPLIIAKVNDKGTSTRDDDKFVGGAVFEIRVDDGDGKYEPNADDGGVVATLKATDGYAVYNPGLPGDYWVKEVDAPNGLSKADAMLVKYRTPETPENCFVVDGKKQCKPDQDNTGGFTVAAIVDSPIGAPPTEARPAAPATDTDPGPDPTPRNDTMWLLLGLVGVASAAAYLARTAPRRQP